MKKRRRMYKAPSADRFSAEAMFSNPVATTNDCTGMTPTVPLTEDEATSCCDLLDVPVSSCDGGEAYKRAK